MEWAAELHCTQTRKGTDVPYLADLLDVAALVLARRGTEAEAVAVLLHDSIEDAGVKPKQIRKRYGRKVSKIVKACTETIDGKLPGKSKAPRDAFHVASARSRRRSTTSPPPTCPRRCCG